MYQMTDKQWEAIPENHRASWLKTLEYAKEFVIAMRDTVAVSLPDGGWGPYGACHVSHVRKKAKTIEAASQEITIAVWSDGTHAPVIGTPEEHLAKLMEECHGKPVVVPAKYANWKFEDGVWCCYGSRAVEMRPVVLP